MSGWGSTAGVWPHGFPPNRTATCTFATPRAFGNHGAGSTLFWIDPELDMTFVCLTTRLLPEADNIERFQRLSDIAISAAL